MIAGDGKETEEQKKGSGAFLLAVTRASAFFRK